MKGRITNRVEGLTECVGSITKGYCMVDAFYLYMHDLASPLELSLAKQLLFRNIFSMYGDVGRIYNPPPHIMETVSFKCGYCFKWRVTPTGARCLGCPISKKLGKPCFELDSFKVLLENPKGIDKEGKPINLRAVHKQFCEDIGFGDVYE